MDFWVDRGDVRLHAVIQGDGPTVLLHTGGLGDGGMWQKYLEPLADFRVVLMDPRGRGTSTKVGTVAGHRIEEYAADAAAMIESVEGPDGPPVGFVGYSMGAQVGYALAATRRELVAGLVGLGGAWEAPSVDQDNDLLRLLDEAGVDGFIEQIENDEHLQLLPWLRQQFVDTDPEQFRLSLRGFASWNPWSVIDRISCPVCLVCGELEDPDGTIGKAAAQLPDATATWLPGLGHIGAYLDVAQVSDVIVPFLDRVLRSSQ
jgi:pimeloyl-ACP methyl ester carboxylesterase